MALDQLVEDELRQASVWWKWQLFLRRSTTLVALACGAVLVLGMGMLWGWFSQFLWPALGIGVVVLMAGAAWIVVGIVTIESRQDRRRMASALERTHQPLMDRLNTLVFLQAQKEHPSRAFIEPIQDQTIDILTRTQPTCPFSWRRTWMQTALCAAVMATTAFFYVYFRPWRSLLAHDQQAPQDHQPLVIPDPETLPEAERPDRTRPQWGEVRISEPGRDLRATRAEIIPIEIEAAASSRLARVDWVSAVNDEPSVAHGLPAPTEPHYAVYPAEIVPDQLGLDQWDVLHYFARAKTVDGKEYVSDVYFIDVIPPREQLQQLPGGADGVPYAVLQHLTGMVERQQEIIRHTNRLSRDEYRSLEDRPMRCQQLAEAEAELAEHARHFEAQLASQLGDDAVSGLEQHLDRVAASLSESRAALDQQDTEAAQQSQLSALSHLAATRKHFDQIVRENPKAFEDQPEAGTSSPQQQALKSSDLLQRMQHQQNQMRDARQFVQKSLLAERNIQRAASPSRKNSFPKLAQNQAELRKDLQQFMEDHSSSFRDAQNQGERAKAAMEQTERQLRNRSNSARRSAMEAADRLLELDQQLENRQQKMNLSNAYRLESLLREQVEHLKQLQSNPSRRQCPVVSAQCRALTGQLKQVAGQLKGDESLGTQLDQALNESQPQLDALTDELSSAESSDEIKSAAQRLREGLETVLQAYDRDGPQGPSGDPATRNQFAPTGQNAIDRGLQQLESMARRRSGKYPTPPQVDERLKRSALDHLGEGLSSAYGNNEQAQQLLDRLRSDLQEPHASVDPDVIRRLIEQIRKLHRESPRSDDPMADRSRAVNIDPSQYPAGYQDAVETYFEKLSETP